MRLRLLVLAIADRCDQRCAHCSIWSGGPRGTALTLPERLQVVEDALAAGAREVLLTGGEPLLSPDLWPIAESVQGAARLYLATNGMRLEAYAARVAALFDEVYVSLDGADASTHDRIRGVAAFERVVRGVQELRREGGVRVVARSVLHGGNLHEVVAIAEAARAAGFHGVSFLPLDARSKAFGGEPAARATLLPTPEQLVRFEEDVARLSRDGFVLEDPDKLRGIGRHLAGAFARPACNAPEWSCVVEAHGDVRPCFFHERTGNVREGLRRVLASEPHDRAREAIRAPNATCDACVCPKHRAPRLRDRLWGAA